MKKKYAVAISLSAIIVVAAVAAFLSMYLDEAGTLYNEGEKFRANKDYAAAITKYQTLVDKYPDSNYAHLAKESRLGDCYYNLGLALYGEQKYGEAVESFKQALAYEGSFQYAAEQAMLDCYFKWGQSLQIQNRYVEALDKYQTIYETESYYSNPSNSSVYIDDILSECYFQYGQFLQDQKNFSGALDLYQLIAQDYHYESQARDAIPKCYYNWASELVASKEYDEAIQKYCIIVENYSGTSWASLGNSSVLREVPDNVLYAWATRLQEEKSYDGAIRLYEILLQYNPASQYAFQADKARIETEIAKVASEKHGSLPQPSVTGQQSLEGKAELTIVNDTPYQLTFLMSGPVAKSVVLPASPESSEYSSPPYSFFGAPSPPSNAERQTITLDGGSYVVVAKVSEAGIDPFYGEMNLAGDSEYQDWFYIVVSYG